MANNIKLIIIILIVFAIIISSIFLVRFGSQYFDFMTPPGIGTINSDHADFKLKIILDSQQLDFDTKTHPELLKINPYIYFEDDWIHRTATGANLQMLLESIDIKFNDNCIVINSEFSDVFGDSLRQTQFCDEGKTKLRMYENQVLKDFDILSYVPNGNDGLVLVYDNIDNKTRSFMEYHHEKLLADHDE